jgi:hypothetical protein
VILVVVGSSPISHPTSAIKPLKPLLANGFLHS